MRMRRSFNIWRLKQLRAAPSAANAGHVALDDADDGQQNEGHDHRSSVRSINFD